MPMLHLAPLQAELTADSPALVLNATSEESPLLMREFYPRWSAMDVTTAEATIKPLMAAAEKKIASITALKPEEMTYANTFDAMASLQDDMNNTFLSVYHLSIVADDPAVRESLQAISLLSDQFTTSVIANEALWSAIKTAAAQPWASKLDPERARYVKQTLDSFRDSGADLSPEKKKRLAEVRKELSLLSIDFGKNVLDSSNAWEHIITDPAQLEGMSENWMESAAAAALAKGYGTKEKPQWLITLAYSSYGPIMSDCSVEATRELCWRGTETIGRMEGHENEPIVQKIVALRHELAQILGFKHYADLTTARRMAETGDKALAFVDDITKKAETAFAQENQHLLNFISELTGKKVEAMKPWNARYYSNELAQKENNFDIETLRPYFSANNMIMGMLDVYSELLSLTFKEVETIYITDKSQKAKDNQVEVWDEEVRLFEIYDTKTGKMLGSFYLDLYPRNEKRQGAWFLPLRAGDSGRNGSPAKPHLGVVCGSFTGPIDGKEAQFSHYEVKVLFHEFGHALHGLLGDTTLRAHTGLNVAWDFVEMPSQLFEYWSWEPSFLKKHAIHHETGEPISDEQIAKLHQSKHYRPANATMGQLGIAKLDLEMHMNYDKHFKGRTLDAATEELLKNMTPRYTESRSSIMHDLTHCMSGGYGAGYYSYKWAEVLCADAFTRFMKEGVNNKKTGADLRATILSQGDSKSANDLYKEFMGREPDNDALLIEQGLLPAKK